MKYYKYFIMKDLTWLPEKFINSQVNTVSSWFVLNIYRRKRLFSSSLANGLVYMNSKSAHTHGKHTDAGKFIVFMGRGYSETVKRERRLPPAGGGV